MPRTYNNVEPANFLVTCQIGEGDLGSVVRLLTDSGATDVQHALVSPAGGRMIGRRSHQTKRRAPHAAARRRAGKGGSCRQLIDAFLTKARAASRQMIVVAAEHAGFKPGNVDTTLRLMLAKKIIRKRANGQYSMRRRASKSRTAKNIVQLHPRIGTKTRAAARA